MIVPGGSISPGALKVSKTTTMLRSVHILVVLCTGIAALSGCFLPDTGLWPMPPDPRQASPITGALPAPLRLETSDGRFCNGVRLDERHVATAAHCVHLGGTVTLIENGVATQADAVAVNPGFEFQPTVTAAGADLAKLTVPAPVGNSATVAIGTIQPGSAQVFALSRSGVLEETVCTYLGRSGAIVELSCLVEPGWSGAPVVQNGALVGIVSARGRGPAQSVVQMADAIRLTAF